MCQLRPYQKQSIEDIRNAFIKGKRKILLVAPTGSGKTVVASEMIRRVVAGGKSCLFVAHRRELIMQCSNKHMTLVLIMVCLWQVKVLFLWLVVKLQVFKPLLLV